MLNKIEVNIIAFGQIAEITGKEFILEATDLYSLRNLLLQKFPELLSKKFAIAVNKKLIQQNINLNQNDVVALMPPYSGG